MNKEDLDILSAALGKIVLHGDEDNSTALTPEQVADVEALSARMAAMAIKKSGEENSEDKSTGVDDNEQAKDIAPTAPEPGGSN